MAQHVDSAAHRPHPAVDPLEPDPLIEGEFDDTTLNDSLLEHVWRPAGRGFYMLLGLCAALIGVLLWAITKTIAQGIGTWGNNIPVGWGFGIVNFVWWIGIGHAGTLISAILLLLQQKWRTSINRFAEAMTLFAVVCAGIFPALHTGRPWYDFFLFPYPSTLSLWPQFKSPLVWDVFAVSTYLTTSLLFWYLGLIPDLAALRDSPRTGRIARYVYGVFALGWRGSGEHWSHYKYAYLLLAGLATPLVLSVHTVVSFDFAVGIIPGWHATIFPPYFVAGAVFSGFAMVVTLAIPAREQLGLKHVITRRHLDAMCKVILATGLIVAYGYMCEHFVAWYGGDEYEAYTFFQNRRHGQFGGIYALMLFCNVLVPQIFWFRTARRSLWIMWIACFLVNIGMWCERFVIVITSLQRDFLPSSWANYEPTLVDWGLYLGTMGLFGFLFLLFLKFLPAVAVTEVKELRHELAHGHRSADEVHLGGTEPKEVRP